jgi:hypothetical protein
MRRRTRRVQKTRRARKTRHVQRTRGGDHHVNSCKNTTNFLINKTNPGAGFKWPDKFKYPGGCTTQPTENIIRADPTKDILFDRFGHEGGKFGSPIENNKPYSYASRALPYIRLENNSQKKCNNVYEVDTLDRNNYHVYKVFKDIPGVKVCSAVAAFNKPGDAIQWEFPDSIADMKIAGQIEEVPKSSIPNFI